MQKCSSSQAERYIHLHSPLSLIHIYIGALNTDKEIGKDRRAELDAALKKLEDKGYGVSFLLFDLKTNSGYFKNADTEYPLSLIHIYGRGVCHNHTVWRR